jgi:uncharacterized RDD family membrane protein YckC
MTPAIPDPPATRTPTSPYAGFASRSAALAIDASFLTVAGLCISVLPGLAWNEVLGHSPHWLGTLSGIVAAVLPWLYFTFCWSFNGQTVGGLLIGIAVERSDGRTIGVFRAALRSAIGLLLAPLWMLGYLGILVDRDRRAWHDVVFRTVVRRKNLIPIHHHEPLEQPSLEPPSLGFAPTALDPD